MGDPALADLRLETIEVSDPGDGIVTVTLNRPGRSNAMTAAMFAGSPGPVDGNRFEIEDCVLITGKARALRGLVHPHDGDYVLVHLV
jgi:enoyl-CoA hydratase/carnithine racemase